MKWLTEWLEIIEKQGDANTVDAVAVEWIGAKPDPEALFLWVDQVRRVVDGRAPIWLTAVSAHGASVRDTAVFLRKVLPWLDEQKDIERYAYAGAYPGILVDEKGGLTEAGRVYNETVPPKYAGKDAWF